MNNLTRTSLVKRVIRTQAFTLLILLVAMILIFTVLAALNGAKFFTGKTFVGILQDIAVPGFLAIGAGCLIVSGNIDLSQATVGALSGIIISIAISWWGLPWYVAILIAFGFAAAIGVINAVLISSIGMAPFIATLAMSAVIRALMQLLATDANGSLQSTITFTDPTLTTIGGYDIIWRIPATVVLVIVAFVVYGLILKKTDLGRSIYMIGGNRRAARLSGINSKGITYFLYINCSILGAIAGIAYTARAKQGGLQALSGDQFTGLTAAILGGISFAGGSGGMGGAFLGLVVLKTFYKGMLIVGSSTYLTLVLSGALLILALSLDVWSQRRQRKRLGV
ncbi:MAG TPA: ABC transporter permease [Papillibacter sp.]|jgi:ribose transport system permease protein|nr:ABC transporter permease [Papillibacter sp.]